MSVFKEHEPCPKCGSKNNLARYEDGSAHCFGNGCDYYEAIDSNFDRVDSKKILETDIDLGFPVELKKRGISKSTCEKFRYNVKGSNGDTLHVANFQNEVGHIVAQKVRGKDKQFYWLGDANKVGLFGQHLWSPNPKLSIVITEGEIDALSIAEVQECKFPVVSVVKGAGGAEKELKMQLDWLSGFKHVTLCFDSDVAGKTAARKCAELFEPGKCKIAEISGKDANEMLCSGKVADLLTSLARAKEYRPDGVITCSDITAKQLMVPDPYGAEGPYPKLNKLMRGFKSGRLYLLCAGTSQGKSTIVKEIAYHLLENNPKIKIGNIFLEESQKETISSYVAIDNNVSLTDYRERPELLGEEKTTKSLTKFGNRLSFYNHFDTLEDENLFSKMRYMMQGLDCNFIILDHISIVISGRKGNGNERKEIDYLISRLRFLIQETGKSVIAVSHLSRHDKDYNAGASVSLSDLRGSGSLEQLADAVIAVERDSFSDHPNHARLKLLKSRMGGQVGYADTICYDGLTGRLSPVDDIIDDKDSDF